MRRCVLSLFIVLGCKRAPPAVTDSRPLLVRYPIRTHVRWTEHRDRFGSVTTHRRDERWTLVGDQTWEVVTTDVETGTPFYRARYSQLSEGLAQTSLIDHDKLVPVEPPRIALPTNTSIGTSFERSHRVGGQQSNRSCKILPHDPCNEGIELRCTTTYVDGRIVEVHNKYCGGVGMVGYTSTTRRIGTNEVVRIWSEDLVDVAP